MSTSIELCFGSTRRNTDSSLGRGVLVLWFYYLDRCSSHVRLYTILFLLTRYRQPLSASKALFPGLNETAFPYIEDRICPLQTALMQATRSTKFEPWTIVIWGDIEMLGGFSSPVVARALGPKMLQFWSRRRQIVIGFCSRPRFSCVWQTSMKLVFVPINRLRIYFDVRGKSTDCL